MTWQVWLGIWFVTVVLIVLFLKGRRLGRRRVTTHYECGGILDPEVHLRWSMRRMTRDGRATTIPVLGPDLEVLHRCRRCDLIGVATIPARVSNGETSPVLVGPGPDPGAVVGRSKTPRGSGVRSTEGRVVVGSRP